MANVAEAGCFGAAVVVKMGPVVHKHSFVSLSSESGASAGAADGTAGDAGITKLLASIVCVVFAGIFFLH